MAKLLRGTGPGVPLDSIIIEAETAQEKSLLAQMRKVTWFGDGCLHLVGENPNGLGTVTIGIRQAICDGCNVRHPHEHRCHEDNIEMLGVRHPGVKCKCRSCHPTEEELAEFRASLEDRAEFERRKTEEGYCDHGVPPDTECSICNTPPPPKHFPLQIIGDFRRKHPMWIPWVPLPIAEVAYRRYAAHYSARQTLEEIGERGGFSPIELDGLLKDGLPDDDPEDPNQMQRAHGDMVCEECGLAYWRHPPCPLFIDSTTNSPYLHRLCDGRLVKL